MKSTGLDATGTGRRMQLSAQIVSLLVCLTIAVAHGIPAEINIDNVGGTVANVTPTTQTNLETTTAAIKITANHHPVVIEAVNKVNPPTGPLPPYQMPRNYNFQVSTLPIPYETRYFTDRTRSDMIEFIDRASRDVDFAESQIFLAMEQARAAVSNDVNDAKNFVIKNHEKELNEFVDQAKDEAELWECAKKGEKFVEFRARMAADRVNDCMKRASSSAMDVVSSTKSHLAEDKARRLQKYSEDVERLTNCVSQQDRNCIREQINLIDRNVNSLAADARGEVDRVREARLQQISEFGLCRRFQDESYLKLMAESDRIIKCCIKMSLIGMTDISLC